MRKAAFPLSTIALVAAMALSAAAQNAAPTAHTTADPRIALPDLQDRLRAPTVEELVVEVEAWQHLLRDKVAEIAETTIQHRAATEEAARAPLLERRTAQDTEKLALQERFGAAIDALHAKGGDAKKYRAYLDAVAGIQIDASDAGAATAAVTNWLKSPDGGLRWGKNIIFALLTLVVFKFLAAIAGGITNAALKRTRLRVTEGLRRFFVGTVKNLVIILGAILALSMLEVDIGPFVAAIGVGGFVIGFAMQQTLGNFAAGILILMYRPFEIGHMVTAAGITGTVEEISLVSTKFLTPDNQTIVVPNGSVWGGVITNITGNATRRVDMSFGIGYGDDIAKAERVLREIVSAHPKVLREPETMIRVNALADSSVSIVCRPWTKTEDYWDVYWDVTRAVKERFAAEGFTIPYPHREIHVHQVK
jgi:small conductance mechanosensitive channel